MKHYVKKTFYGFYSAVGGVLLLIIYLTLTSVLNYYESTLLSVFFGSIFVILLTSNVIGLIYSIWEVIKVKKTRNLVGLVIQAVLLIIILSMISNYS